MSILTVDDNASQRNYLVELLTKASPQALPVLKAEDGEAAVEIAVAEVSKIWILEIQMPQASGSKRRGRDRRLRQFCLR